VSGTATALVVATGPATAFGDIAARLSMRPPEREFERRLSVGVADSAGRRAFLFVPFLPMLPTQILLDNFLYDLAQITIATDNVDDTFIRTAQRWDLASSSGSWW
jgi:magnesium-transporting ATPase (P-type)